MRATDPTFPLFPIFAFLGFVLSVIPLPWHFQAWNSGTCAFMIWVGLLCLIEFINSLIWAGDAINRLPVWCDITSQLIAGAGIGIPASILCISRRLYRIVSTQTVSITRDDKRRAIYQDLAIVIGLPVLVLVLHIIVQPHRFNIFEEYGCSIATYNTLPAVFLYYISPIVIGLVSFVYSALILRTFYVRRIQFNHLFSTNSAINPSRYLRLMLLALMDILCTIPLGIYMVYIDLKSVPLAPWISWADTHFDFGRVELVPAVIWRSSPDSAIAIEINRWTPVFCAFIFFALFGFAEEARKNYRRAFWFVVKPLGFRPTSEKGISGGKGKSGIMSGLKKFKLKGDDKDVLPVYAPPTNPASARKEFRKSMLDAESRSTICFPDDDVELGLYQKSFDRNTITPSSPSSSTSLDSPRTPITPPILGSPPSYVDSAHLDAAARALAEEGKNPETDPRRKSSWVSLPDFILETSEPSDSERFSRPSSYRDSYSYSVSNASYISRREHSHGAGDHLDVPEHGEDDHISITDAYFDYDSSRPTSPIRVPTPIPFTPELTAELSSRLASGQTQIQTQNRNQNRTETETVRMPVPPPPALAFHRPFSPPSAYPPTMPHILARDANEGNGQRF